MRNNSRPSHVVTEVWIGPLGRRVRTTVYIGKYGSFVTVGGVNYTVVYTGVWRTPRKETN